MESVSKKICTKEKPEFKILVIDDDEIASTRIRSLLLRNEKFRFRIAKTCDLSEIRRKIKANFADLIFYGLKASDPRNQWMASVLVLPGTPPIIGLKSERSSRFPDAIAFQSSIFKNKLDTPTLMELVSRYFESRLKKRSIEDGIRELKSSELRFLHVILESPDGTIISNKKGKILFQNPAAQLLLGDTPQTQIPVSVLFNHNNKKRVQEITYRGTGKVVEVRLTEILWNTDQVILFSLRDITHRKQAEIALSASEKRYELALKGSRDGLWDWNLKSGDLYFSPQWNSMLGLQDISSSCLLKEWFSKVHPSDLRKIKRRLDRHLDGSTEYFECEYRILHKNGSWLWVIIRGKATRTRQGKAVRITGLQSDITERKKAERQLKKSLEELRFALASEKILMEELDKKNKELIELSITDGLTGLYNHRFLQERFDFEYKRVKRYGGFLSCMMIDIDHFKLINDTYGHQFGDQVLRQLSDLLRANSREVDICGRYGGEEFMVITNVQANDTLKFALKLHAAIENYVFKCGQKKVHVTVSIGISEFQTEIKSKQQLIEQADTALYQAKTDGRNLIRIWKMMETHDEILLDKFSTESMKSQFLNLSNQMRSTYMESTNAIVKAVDAKDPFAKEHSNNVSKYSVKIAKGMNLPNEDIEVIRYAALLHDVGKISIKDEILTKKEALTNNELQILKRHPEVGVNILKDLKFLEKEIPIILHHHERFDGNGYPYGLKQREIPLGARIVSVADAIDAMISGRTYRKRLNWKMAINEIVKGKGKQFAPEIVDIVVKLFKNKELG